MLAASQTSWRLYVPEARPRPSPSFKSQSEALMSARTVPILQHPRMLTYVLAPRERKAAAASILVPARQEKRKMRTWLQKLFGTSPADEEAPDFHLMASSQTAL